MTGEEFFSQKIRHVVNRSSDLGGEALVALGREQDVDRSVYKSLKGLTLANSDVRMSSERGELFARAGLPEQPQYFDEALVRGFDVRRFYESDPREPFLVCPYCLSRRTPADICWACGEETGRDAAIEVTRVSLDAMKRKTCVACKTMIPDVAIRCPACRARQAPI